MKRSLVLTATCAAFLLPTGTSQGAVIFQGNWRTGTAHVNTPTLVITSAITFQITATGDVAVIVFDNILSSDDTTNNGAFSTSVASLSIVNAGSGQNVSIDAMYDSNGDPIGVVDRRDSYLLLGSTFSVTNGTSVTINPGTFTFTANASWNPQLQNGYTFTGNAFLIDTSITSISNLAPVGVPEPSALLLSALGVMGLLRRNRGRGNTEKRFASPFTGQGLFSSSAKWMIAV